MAASAQRPGEAFIHVMKEDTRRRAALRKTIPKMREASALVQQRVAKRLINHDGFAWRLQL
jgi:hypothetical protein